jgi:transposase InsO family protein
MQSNSTTDSVLLKKMVMGVRAMLPKTGGRKLHSMLNSQIKSQGMKIVRDKLFDFLREEHLLIKTRRKYHKTTNSRHWMRKYPNLIRDIEICMPEQVWVADITYLVMKKKHYYLHLITDAYSKKIVGYQLADNLQAETTLNALKQAISNRIYSHKLIHHSDRGLQYCSSQYTALLSGNGISISMTENSDPYENAVAERVNGILKDEFMLDINFESYYGMKKQVQQSIHAYNHLRLHTSIGMLTPNRAHLQQKIILKTWKKRTLFL